MNKTQFVRKNAEVHGITIKQSGEEVDRFFATLEAVVPTLADGEAVNLTGYIKLTAKDVAEREARNPATGETVQVPATRKLSVKAGAKLKAAVKGE